MVVSLACNDETTLLQRASIARLVFNTVLKPAYCKTAEGCRCRLLATYWTLEAVPALPRAVSSRQI